MVKSGGALRAGGMKQRYQCNDCGYPLVMNDEEYVPRRKRVNR
jgi:transposase-like protein